MVGLRLGLGGRDGLSKASTSIGKGNVAASPSILGLVTSIEDEISRGELKFLSISVILDYN